MADPIDIYVDLDALQTLANQLGQINDALSHADDDLSGYAPALGSQRVGDKLGDFVDGWKDGRKKIEDNIKNLLDKVQGIAQTYQEQEDQLAKSSDSGGQR